MSDFAASSTAQKLNFSDGKRWEIVVQHEAFFGFAFERLQDAACRRCVPSVVVTRAWVSPRVKIAEPCVRGRTPTSIRDVPDLIKGAAIRTLLSFDYLLRGKSARAELVIGFQIFAAAVFVFFRDRGLQFFLELAD